MEMYIKSNPNQIYFTIDLIWIFLLYFISHLLGWRLADWRALARFLVERVWGSNYQLRVWSKKNGGQLISAGFSFYVQVSARDTLLATQSRITSMPIFFISLKSGYPRKKNSNKCDGPNQMTCYLRFAL